MRNVAPRKGRPSPEFDCPQCRTYRRLALLAAVLVAALGLAHHFTG